MAFVEATVSAAYLGWLQRPRSFVFPEEVAAIPSALLSRGVVARVAHRATDEGAGVTSGVERLCPARCDLIVRVTHRGKRRSGRVDPRVPSDVLARRLRVDHAHPGIVLCVRQCNRASIISAQVVDENDLELEGCPLPK
jgi:hypothetical protein